MSFRVYAMSYVHCINIADIRDIIFMAFYTPWNASKIHNKRKQNTVSDYHVELEQLGKRSCLPSHSIWFITYIVTAFVFVSLYVMISHIVVDKYILILICLLNFSVYTFAEISDFQGDGENSAAESPDYLIQDIIIADSWYYEIRPIMRAGAAVLYVMNIKHALHTWNMTY